MVEVKRLADLINYKDIPENKAMFRDEYWLPKLKELQEIHKKGYEMGLLRREITLDAESDFVR